VPEIELAEIDIKLEVPCPRCEFVLLCDPALEGTRGLCPNCKFIFTINPPGEEGMLEPEASLQMTFAFQCPHCKQLFEGKPGMEGRKGKCIHCQEVFEIKKYVDPSALIVTKAPTEEQQTTAANQHSPHVTAPVAEPAIPTIPYPTANPVTAKPVVAKPIKPQPISHGERTMAAPIENKDWMKAVPAHAHDTYSPSGNQYASSMPAIGDSAPTATGDSVSLRNFYLAHESAVKGFGLLYAVGAGLNLLIACLAVCLAIFVFVNGNANNAPIGIMVLVYALVYFVTGALTALVSSGLSKLSDVGKIGGSIFSLLGLCAFPIGTAMGAYLLYLIFSEKGNVVFSPRYREIVRQTPHIRAYIPLFVWVVFGLGAFMFLLVGLLFLFSFVGVR
jgi:hypothetical protein